MKDELALKKLEEHPAPFFLREICDLFSQGESLGLTSFQMSDLVEVYLKNSESLKYILELGGCTSTILMENFSMSRDQAWNLLHRLERCGLIYRADRIKLRKQGPGSILLLVEGTDIEKIKEIKQLHVDLQREGVIRPIHSFQTKQMADRIVDSVIERHRGGSIKESTLKQAIRTHNEVYDEDLWRRIQLEVKERGRRIDYAV